MMGDVLVSVIIPVYNESNHIKSSISEILTVLESINLPYQMILVDDGSKDESWIILKELAAVNPSILALKLSRNFGKEAAICAGLDIAGGDSCIVMDGDLQHPPELIPEMVRLWQEGYEVIEAVKTSRGSEPLYNRLGAVLFYSLLNRLSGYDLENASDYKLLDAKVLDSWHKFGERNTFFRALSLWLGYKRTTIPFQVHERKSGSSKWPVLKLVKLAVNAIASFSSIPLQLVSLIGSIFFLAAIVLGIQTLVMKWSGQAAGGFTTVILLQLFIGSLIMISLGIIGTYISKIFDEVKARPRYIVSEKAGQE